MSKFRVVTAILLLVLVVAPAYAADGDQDGWSPIQWLEEQIAELCGLIGDSPDDVDGDDSGTPDLGPAADPLG